MALDLSAIVAGSGIRGAFEEKFKALLRDIEDEVSGISGPHNITCLNHKRRVEMLFASLTSFIRCSISEKLKVASMPDK